MVKHGESKSGNWPRKCFALIGWAEFGPVVTSRVISSNCIIYIWYVNTTIPINSEYQNFFGDRFHIRLCTSNSKILLATETTLYNYMVFAFDDWFWCRI